jgi:hypothetical protein
MTIPIDGCTSGRWGLDAPITTWSTSPRHGRISGFKTDWVVRWTAVARSAGSRDALMDWPEDREDWFVFSEDRRRGRAREWLADAGYRPPVGTRTTEPD